VAQENVEIMKAGFDAWNAGDMDAFRDLYDVDVLELFI
jgi:ketosteroid isomerase-like protein